jgi:hypothetical protein
VKFIEREEYAEALKNSFTEMRCAKNNGNIDIDLFGDPGSIHIQMVNSLN